MKKATLITLSLGVFAVGQPWAAAQCIELSELMKSSPEAFANNTSLTFDTPWLYPSAEQGNDGQRQSQNAERCRQAAERGSADDQFRLGVLYCKGRGVPVDFDEAAKWLRKAAEQGHQPARDALLTIRSLQVEEQGEDIAALSIMMDVANEKPSSTICWTYVNQISRVLQRVIDDFFADGGLDTMLEKRIIVDRLARFDAVRDSIEFLVNKLEHRLGDDEYNLAETKEILGFARSLKERACTNRTNYVSYYVAWPYLHEARRLFNAAINVWSPNDREKIRQGVRLLTRALNKELLEQSDEPVRDYVISLKKQLKDLVYESEYNEFISESTLWDSNDPYKKNGADAWWSSSKYYKGESRHTSR